MLTFSLARSRTKEQIREVRHAYVDLDEEAGASLQTIRNSVDVPLPNFVLDTSPGNHQVVWQAEVLDTSHAEASLRGSGLTVRGRPCINGYFPAAPFARIHEPEIQRVFNFLF